jgi:hypothetical protein
MRGFVISSGSTVQSELVYRAARRSYERARWKLSFVHAAAISLGIALVSAIALGRSALVWVPLTVAAWTIIEWRGGPLLHGGRYGIFAGVITLLLPMSILRPCCIPGAVVAAGASCCTMPGACGAAGAAVGLAFACLVPLGRGRKTYFETALGMTLAWSSMAPMRCTGLFVGEALGLVGGLLAGIVAASTARALWSHSLRASSRTD